jgi:hypothetical protein
MREFLMVMLDILGDYSEVENIETQRILILAQFHILSLIEEHAKFTDSVVKMIEYLRHWFSSFVAQACDALSEDTENLNLIKNSLPKILVKLSIKSLKTTKLMAKRH